MTAIQEKHQFIAEAKMLKVLMLIRLLCDDRYTVIQLAERLDTTKRTIARYFALLEFMDIPIDKDFEGKYFIAQGHCPLCGVTTNNHNE